MVAAITVRLPWPPTVNTYWRHVAINGKPRTMISKRGREYRSACAGALLEQGAACMGLVGRLAVEIYAAPPDRRVRDLDNLPKAILDAITHAGTWGDDSQVDYLSITRMPVDREHAGLRVRITSLDGSQNFVPGEQA